MPPNLLLIFNHELTEAQIKDAEASLGVDRIVDLPEHLKSLWRQIPPDILDVTEVIAPIAEWLKTNARLGDYVLIQGDFGAVYRMVNIAFDFGLLPVYATTRRRAEEHHCADGTVEIIHQFQHVRFRDYTR